MNRLKDNNFKKIQLHKRLFSRNKRYASTLLHMAHVDPFQQQLVLLIGMGHERSNHEALCYWLSVHANSEDPAPCEMEIKRLFALLESTINHKLNPLEACHDS